MPTAPPIRYHLMARRAPEGPFELGSLVPETDATRGGPLELEIGFGRGRFLMERARAAPGSRIVGIEIKAKWAHLVEERRKRDGLENACALSGDAREVLPRAQPDGCLTRVFVLFPDPWWKQRHVKRRVVDDGFLDQIARLVKKGGELYVATDVEDRAESMAERIAEHGAFELRECLENPYGARSNREARAEEDGLPFQRILGIRR